MSRLASRGQETKSRSPSIPGAPAVPNAPRRSRPKIALLLIGVAVVVIGLGAAAWYQGGLPTREWSLADWWKKKTPAADRSNPAAAPSSIQLLEGTTDVLAVPRDMKATLGIDERPVRPATEWRPLELSPAQLGLDPDYLQRVHSYFPGEVVEIGTVVGPPDNPPALITEQRQLRVGDKVVKGQLLAVIYNADLGNKKSSLIDALSQLRIDEEHYRDLEELYKKGAVSDFQLRQQKRQVETDLNSVRAAERTLRTWRVPEEEIQAVREEAERIFKEGRKPNPDKEKNWARVEIKAKQDGTVLERNFTVGDVVDTSTDLFKIASLKKLLVWASAYEEDLPALRHLTPEQRRWTVRPQTPPNAKAQTGTIDYINPLIDPNQHTAPVRGRVNNEDEKLSVNQFVTATVLLPPPGDEAVIPATALDDDGSERVVYVKLDPTREVKKAQPDKDYYQRRRVAVTRRDRKEIYVRSSAKRLTAAEKQQQVEALEPGRTVVSSGVILLQAALDDLQSAAAQAKSE